MLGKSWTMPFLGWRHIKKNFRNFFFIFFSNFSLFVKKNPNPICFYDKTKGVFDFVGMVIGKYITKYKTRRWTMNVFAYMLDTARTNARTVFKEIKHDICTFDFIWELGKLLVNAHITRCLANPVGLQQTVIKRCVTFWR